ncbi:MAG: 7-cyano-7-deazaguanine synthase QueC, partial [Candidatus Aminicenantales bacterium]
MSKSIVLFSGGIDSTTALYWALSVYQEVLALTFDYGQRHRLEVSMAQKIAQKLKVPHKILKLDLGQIGGSSLTDPNYPLPEFKSLEEIGAEPPSTYVPFRNGIMLAMAAALAETQGIWNIICGFNVIDSPHYPDTRREFVAAMEKAINAGTKASFSQAKFHLLSPFINLPKSEIIKKGLSFGADYSYSLSCYSGQENPCQKCSSCLLRQKAWQEVGLPDPLIV